MATGKKSKKTPKKTAGKSQTQGYREAIREAASGGDAPAAARAVSPPPPPPATADAAFVAKQAALDAIASKYNKEGHAVLVRGDEAPNPYILRRPTGIMELDIHLAGGWPAGGTCFVSGPDNAGKTWLMMQTMAMQQRLYGHKCVQAYAITEGGFPYDQALRVGLRIAVPDEMLRQWQDWRTQRGLAPYTTEELRQAKEQVGDIRIVRGETGEELLTVVLRIVQSRACSVICLDSLQGLQPVVDAAKEMDEAAKQAAHANMMTEFFKRYVPLTTGLSGVNETTLLMTQQVRSNRAKSAAPSYMQAAIKDWTIAGSYSARHFKLVDLVLYDGALQRKEVDGVKQVVGKVMKWETEKGKAGTHDNIHGEVQYSYLFPQGVDFTGTVMDSAMQRGVLRKIGNQYVVVRPDTNEVRYDFSAPSLKKFRECMDVDFDFELMVRQEVLASAGVQCLYR
jgi:RecA/RadA recombinase